MAAKAKRYILDFHTGQEITVEVRHEGRLYQARIVKPDLSYFSGAGPTAEVAIHSVMHAAMMMGDLPRMKKKRTRKNPRRRTSKRSR